MLFFLPSMVCKGLTSIFCYLVSTLGKLMLCASVFHNYFPKNVGAGEIIDKISLGNVLYFKIKLPNIILIIIWKETMYSVSPLFQRLSKSA